MAVQAITKPEIERALHDKRNIRIRVYPNGNLYHYLCSALDLDEAHQYVAKIKKLGYIPYIKYDKGKVFEVIYNIYVGRGKPEVGKVRKHVSQT